MIVPMVRVLVAGPRAQLDGALSELQDGGALHLVRSSGTAMPIEPRSQRHLRHLRRTLDDAEATLRLLCVAHPGIEGEGRAGSGANAERAGSGGAPLSLAKAARLARHLRRRAEALSRRLAAAKDERVLLLRYREFFAAFASLLGHELTWADGHAFYVVLRAGAAEAVAPLRRSLETAVGAELELLARPLASGETAVLLLVPKEVAPKVSRLLAESRVQDLPAPPGLGETSLLRAMPKLKARLLALEEQERALRAEREALRESCSEALLGLRAQHHDRLLVLEARAQAHAGAHLFIIEGFLPRAHLAPLARRLTRALGSEVVVETVETQGSRHSEAPVALENRPVFRPFEIITRMLPLPKYGTIDPTPFVAVFFPLFFGLMLGDVGYGSVLAILCLALWLRVKRGSALRAVAAVGGACAAFSILFGVAFGELFGTLGHALGLRPLAFDREHAVVPFLVLAIGLGVLHVLLGLLLAVVTAWRQRQRREAMGRGVALFMVSFTVLALLAALGVLPPRLFPPFAAGVVVALPLLIALEGVVALVELLSTYGHILSYARLMALGTASLMLAVVANDLVGAMGSVLMGTFFALLLHGVNFAIGLFSPSIHALRLHYVEFFGKFYRPGGTSYRPLAHWRPAPQEGG